MKSLITWIDGEPILAIAAANGALVALCLISWLLVTIAERLNQ